MYSRADIYVAIYIGRASVLQGYILGGLVYSRADIYVAIYWEECTPGLYIGRTSVLQD